MQIKSIQAKVFLMLLLLTIVLVLVLSLTMRQGVSREFHHYRKSLDDGLVHHIVKSLQQYYKKNNSWNELQENNKMWSRMITRGAKEVSFSNSNRQFKGIRMADHKERKRLDRLADRFVLLNEQKIPVVGVKVNDSTPYLETPVFVNKQAVGFLMTKNPQQQSLDAGMAFANNVKYFLFLLAGVILVLVAAASIPISKYFTKPVLQLIGVTKQAAAGDYSARADIRRNDELGQLGQNFNLLTSTLQSNAEVQKKMMADISHELRTPVAVLQAQVEAIQDGVHLADEKNLTLLHQQISSLSHLINDLHQLSVADLGSLQYQMTAVEIKPIIETVCTSVQFSADEKNITIDLDSQHIKTNAKVMGDGVRLQQMFNNLLVNAVAYTDAGGQIKLHLFEDLQTGEYVIEVQDSAPGLLPHEMEQIFDRLYRKETSRNKKLGGSGLGLAITKNIVAAHHGTIKAEPSELGGVKITVKLAKYV